jgi:PAS domain S-box-containing protein
MGTGICDKLTYLYYKGNFLVKYIRWITNKLTFNDQDDPSNSSLLRSILWVVIIFVGIIIITEGFIGGRSWIVQVLVPVLFFLLLSLYLIRFGILFPAKLIVPLVLWFVVTYLIAVGGGMHDVAMVAFIAVIVVASLTLGVREMFLFCILVISSISWIGLQELSGKIVNEGSIFTTIDEIILLSILVLCITFLQRLLITRMQARSQQARESERLVQIQLKQLLSSEERYRNFIDHSVEGIWMLSFDHPIPLSIQPDEQVRLIHTTSYVSECNDVLAKMYGFENREEIIGTRLMDLYGNSPSDANFQATLALVNAGYRLGGRETVEYTKDGREVHFLNSGVGIIDNHTLVGLWGTQLDITDQKRVENALRNSEARIRALLETIPDMIFEISSDGTFLSFIPSKNTEPVMPPQLFIGRKISEILPENVSSVAMSAIRTALENNVPQSFEYFLQEELAIHHFEARVVTIRPEVVLGIVRDITLRKEVETEREMLIAELEAKNTELERFTYTVSHDLKSPLITIRGFLGFLEKDVINNDMERFYSDINRIVDATEKMQELLNSLLELSRIGRLVHPPVRIPFETIVNLAMDLTRGQLDEKNVQVTVMTGLPEVYVDHDRVVEAVQNLLDNAVKFMGEQPNPKIEFGYDGYDKIGKPIFYIRDNGIGIEPQYHERVFGLFNKLNPDQDGVGIGLSLVKRIIEVHGGRIWIDSEGRNMGTTFYFTLPKVPDTKDSVQK